LWGQREGEGERTEEEERKKEEVKIVNNGNLLSSEEKHYCSSCRRGRRGLMSMASPGLYRRELPSPAIEFASPLGKVNALSHHSIHLILPSTVSSIRSSLHRSCSATHTSKEPWKPSSS